MRNTILILIYCIFSFPCFSNPIPFLPIVRNYVPADYDGGSQNWSVAQDSKGRMYFANNKGLLEFDGNRWTIYPISTNGILRSVYIDGDDRIYVGSFEEFGYFERDETNRLQYQSLKHTVDDYIYHNDEIWTIFKAGNEIIFHSFASYFVYDGIKTAGHKLSRLPLNFFAVADTIYSQQINGGLNIFNNNEFNNILGRDSFGNNDVITGLPYGNNTLFLTKNNGCFLYDGHKLARWETECDDELKANTINKAIITRDSSYIIGTITNGVYALDKGGKLIWRINADNQLTNNTVLNLFCDASNNIWVALDNGIAYIYNNSHIYYFEPQARKIGMVYDVLVDRNKAYIASNQGLYCLEGSTGQLNMMPGMSEQAWTVSRWGDQIICGHNNGIFRITPSGDAEMISTIKGGMSMKEGKIENEDIIIQGTYTFPLIYKKNRNGQWHFTNPVMGFTHMAKNIEIDHRGNVWVEHMRKGLYRFRLNPELTRATDIRFYKSLTGDNSHNKCYLFNMYGRVAFSDGENFYTYDDLMDSIIPYTQMNEGLAGIKGIHTVNRHLEDMYWFLSDREAYLVHCGLTEFNVVSKVPFSIFRNPPLEERARMIYDPVNNCSYLCLNNSIAQITYTGNRHNYETNKPELLFTGFKAVNDRTGEVSYQPLSGVNKIEPEYNQIEIRMAYPVYNDPQISMRYKLKGLSDSWTTGKSEFKKVYTRLPAGNYCFIAEIFDETGTLSALSIPFLIARSWYASFTAITIYVILFFLLLSVLLYVVYSYTKRKKDKVIENQRVAHETRIQAQQKKIIELERNQLEVDLKFKSKELSGVVMTNIAHQEFLTALRDEIRQQKLAGQYGRKNYDKLLIMLNQNIVSDEESWNMFQANFDRIHEYFFRNLKEKYHDLTSGDLRLCALLRLNLPTKEICKLMNISIRGVDAARYRLRKKLGLAQESSLTDFMINFK